MLYLKAVRYEYAEKEQHTFGPFMWAQIIGDVLIVREAGSGERRYLAQQRWKNSDPTWHFYAQEDDKIKDKPCFVADEFEIYT